MSAPVPRSEAVLVEGLAGVDPNADSFLRDQGASGRLR